MNIFIDIIMLVIGFVMLIKGANWLVEGAAGLADRLKISQLAVGLTLVAFGTSVPEAAFSIHATLAQNTEIAIGNVIGSNILNILLILGISSAIIPIKVKRSTLKYEIPFMIGSTVLLFVLGVWGEALTVIDGFLFLGYFVCFIYYLIYMSKNGTMKATEEGKRSKDSALKSVIYTVFGFLLVIVGSEAAVKYASQLALFFGDQDRLIGLTIVAIGTSLPELMTSIVAAKKGRDDIAIGNIVGSNIFNILFVLGIAAFITPLPFSRLFRIDTVVAIAAAILLWLCVFKDQKLARRSGILMLIGYGAYLLYLLF